MSVREAFLAEGMSLLNREGEKETRRINMLRVAWFEHMCNRYSDADVDSLLKRIAKTVENEERRKQMLTESSEMKRDILLQEMIVPKNIPDGVEEGRWFREVFLDFEQFPDHKEMIKRFAERPEETEQILSDMDDIFRESITTH